MMNAIKVLIGGMLMVAGTTHAEPLVLGDGKGMFTVGEKLYETDFSNPDEWVLQISENEKEPGTPRVRFGDGMLDLYMPARGCTAWLKQKFEGPIAIVYRVKCPTEAIDGSLIQARDINNFWHCSDPRKFDRIFETDEDHYNGDFVSYHEMVGYYASTGGGGHDGNQTTRFRRYPRWLDGKDIPHLSLNDKDGNPDYLITPGAWHTVQLVACNGMAQYIVDGKVVYEIKYGDEIIVESRPDGSPVREEQTYSQEKFPPYTEGHFGFRLVRTHHQYKDLSIYQLRPSATTSE